MGWLFELLSALRMTNGRSAIHDVLFLPLLTFHGWPVCCAGCFIEGSSSASPANLNPIFSYLRIILADLPALDTIFLSPVHKGLVVVSCKAHRTDR